MYRNMFFLAFFALTRIGELCISVKNVDNVLTISSLVQIKGSDNLRVVFTNYKHSSHPVGVTVVAPGSSYCPVRHSNTTLLCEAQLLVPCFSNKT